VAGDSLTTGTGVGIVAPYPSVLNALLGAGYNVINGGTAGFTVAQMKTKYEATARNYGRCIFLGGINDIIRDSHNAATAYATASALLDEMRTDGCKPIIITTTPAKGCALGGGSITEYSTYRTDLAGYCSTYPSTTTCIDTWGNGPSSGMGDGTSPPALYSTYDGSDHCHESAAGANKLANLVYAGASWP
jgi:lysophospholipase L1-like esterase